MVLTEDQILAKVNEISRDTLTKIKETKRNVSVRLMMASNDIDIYIGNNTGKFYAKANNKNYVLN